MSSKKAAQPKEAPAPKFLGVMDIPSDVYHAAPGISASMLKDMNRSPRHYWAAHVDPHREPRKQSDAMALGTAIHAAVLEPETWADRFIVMPDVDGRTKEGKEAKAAARALAAERGATLITEADHIVCMKIREAVGAHSLAGGLLRHGTAERSFFVDDAETGARLKCRPDKISASGYLLDVKSCRDASPAIFGAQAARLGYDIQAAHYLDVYRQQTGTDAAGFIFIAVETEAPFAIGVYYMDEAQIATGREKARRLLDRILTCTAENAWPDYGMDEPMLLQLPKWAALIED